MEDIYYDRNTDEQTTASGGVLDYIAGSSAAAAPSNNDSVHDPLAYYDLYSSNTDFSSTPDGKEAIQPVETPVPATSSLSLPTFSMPTIPSMPSFKIERRKSKSEKAKEVEVKEKTDSGSSTPRKCKADDIPIMDSPLRMQLLRSSITNKTDSPNIQERKVIKKEAYPAPVTVHDYFDDGGHSGYDSPASAINQDPPVNSKENNMSVISAILSSQIDNSNTSTPLDRTVEGTPVKDRSRQGSPSLPRKDSPSADGNSEDEEAHSMLSAEYARALRTLTNVLGKGLTVIKYGKYLEMIVS